MHLLFNGTKLINFDVNIMIISFKRLNWSGVQTQSVILRMHSDHCAINVPNTFNDESFENKSKPVFAHFLFEFDCICNYMQLIFFDLNCKHATKSAPATDQFSN